MTDQEVLARLNSVLSEQPDYVEGLAFTSVGAAGFGVVHPDQWAFIRGEIDLQPSFEIFDRVIRVVSERVKAGQLE